MMKCYIYTGDTQNVECFFILGFFFGSPSVPAERSFLSSLTADSSCQLDVLWHNGHTLGVNGAQVGVLKQTDQVSFAGLLQLTKTAESVTKSR